MPEKPPLTVAEIQAELRFRIEHVFKRPMLYSHGESSAEVLDAILWQLCTLLTYTIGRSTAEFQKNLFKAFERTGCNEYGFVRGFRRHNPDARLDEVIKFVLDQWRTIYEGMQTA